MSESANRQTNSFADLHFSQNNLQDYTDCPRRFQLRHLQKVIWPAVKAEPIAQTEQNARLGRRFHRMAHQYALGIPAEQLEAGLDDDDLRLWWHNFVAAPPPKLPATIHRAEVTLSTVVAGYRLTARYDLLAADPGGRLVIVDWKTKRPKNPKYLLKKLQSIVYPYVLVEAGAAFNVGHPVRPEQVSMIYWFADFPDDLLSFSYDSARHDTNRQHLAALIHEIEARCAENIETWPLAAADRACKYCVYRSLCNRGRAAGDLDDLDEDLEFEEVLDIDLEQIGEIAFQ